MDKNKLVSSRIKEARVKKNYLQSHVAKALNISETAYSRIENAQTQLTINNLFQIAEVLETSVNTLIGAEGNNNISNQNNLVVGQTNHCSINVSVTKEQFDTMYDYLKDKL